MNIGTPKNGHPGCPYSRKYRHLDAHIYVNMGTRMAFYNNKKGLGLGLGLAFRKRGSLYSRWGPHIHVNMGTPGCPYLRGVYIFMTPEPSSNGCSRQNA